MCLHGVADWLAGWLAGEFPKVFGLFLRSLVAVDVARLLISGEPAACVELGSMWNAALDAERGQQSATL